ncbi:hypothetical protein [Mycolicibacterium aubagnense]|uniref:Uncharacterized protein n=1 Tax=Mycolicibacterium aubagnense TaxID=319707 RepID=A0ABM7IKX2_9MYCO|nr:hypothetical protein [Mycolicibacterium aubagnense]TLH65237.1 hypothetical protein C1S80_09965 [Mycolicibacterium aubagnense]WGI31162.1 hypothetical protein QDT91_18085 [Mycolicibacterium aubagnense]BBX87446.1 hypothetical protein MAUB_53190 [Mycolicibacterium aubagnense]
MTNGADGPPTADPVAGLEMNPTTLRSWTIDQEPDPPVRYRSKQKEQNLTKADIAMNLAYSTRTGVVLPSTSPTLLRVADYDFGDDDSAGLPFGMSRIEAPMSQVITDEVDGASRYLTLEVEILLIAALGRAIDRVIGPGQIVLDVAAADERAGGALAVVRRIPLQCVSYETVSATEMLRGVCDAFGQAIADPDHVSEVFFSYGMTPINGAHPGPAHLLELRAYRGDGLLQLDWWYASSRFSANTIEELAEQFTLAAIELTAEAEPTVRTPAIDR